MLAKATILIGAGASLEFGMVSTKDVYKYIIERFEKDERSEENFALEILNKITCKLSCFYKDEEKVNFESIFHTLTILSAHLFSISNETSDNFKFIDTVVVKIKKSFYKYSYDNLYFVESKYITFLNELFIEKSKNFLKDDKNDSFVLKEFFNSFLSKYKTKIFSLNYDNLPLQCTDSLYTGMTKEGKFDKNIFCNVEDKHIFFQLHGSIHYEFKDGEIKWINNLDGKINKSQFLHRQDGSISYEYNIITGYDKSNRLQKKPYRTFMSIFENEISSCDVVYIIGYSFGDLHINEILKDYLEKKQVIFIDYSKTLIDYVNAFEKFNNAKLSQLPLSSLNFFSEQKLGRDISLMNSYDYNKEFFELLSSSISNQQGENKYLINLGNNKYLWIYGFKSFIKDFF